MARRSRCSGCAAAGPDERRAVVRDGAGRRGRAPIVADKLLKGEFQEIKAIMQKSREIGMMTFDTSLFQLYDEGAISYDEAIGNADQPTNCD